MNDNRTVCPKCGYERKSIDDINTSAEICPSCGVVYKKYVSYLESNKKKKKPQNNKYFLRGLVFFCLFIAAIFASYNTEIYRTYRAKHTVDVYLDAMIDGDTKLGGKYNNSGKTFFIVFDYEYLNTAKNETDEEEKIETKYLHKAVLDHYCSDSNDGTSAIYKNLDIFKIIQEATDAWSKAPSSVTDPQVLCVDKDELAKRIINYYLDAGYKSNFSTVTPFSGYLEYDIIELSINVPYKSYEFQYQLEHTTKAGTKVFSRYNFHVVREKNGKYFINNFEEINH